MWVLGQANTAHPPSVPTAARWTWPVTISAHVRKGGDELVDGDAIGPRQAERVHGRDAGRQRQVVHGHDRGRVAILGEPGLQPREPLGAERAVVAAGLRGVAADEPQRTAARHVAVVLARGVGDGERQREALAQRRAIVVVAGEHVHRHRQRREQLAGALVLARAAVLGEVAAHEDRAGRGIQRGHRAHRGGQRDARGRRPRR